MKRIASILYIQPTLERKFIGIASIIILACSLIANILIVNLYRDQVFKESRKRALLISEYTAISFSNTLLYQKMGLIEEGGLIENYIIDLVSDQKSAVKNVIVIDNDNKIIASSDYRIYTNPGQYRLANTQDVKILPDKNQLATFTVFYPLKISTQYYGTLSIQFSRLQEIHEINEFKQWMLMITLAFAFIGIFLAILVAFTLAKPIKRLAAEMTHVNAPGYTANLVTSRRDEIGVLEQNFVEMLTRLKEVAEEKERHQHALIQTEKMASVGTLVSGLAHEINNPLGGIRNCLGRISTRPEDINQTKKYALLMNTALARIEKIVRDLLNFSRKDKLVFKQKNINDIIREAYGLIIYKSKKRALNFEWELQKKPPKVNGDKHYLQQVIMNLLLNAIDATPESGTISIKTKTSGHSTLIEIGDTGRGVPAELQNKIFDPFFTTKPIGQGTGLGLSVCKVIIEEHKGKIEYVRTENQSIFRITLPEMN
jgi:two-component system, NtrC family, sensor kinase